MKEIYRGKRTEDEKWVEGWFLGAECTTSIIDDNHDIWPVIPETLGQFTSLLDKNGKKIFEGDIVKYKSYVFDGRGPIDTIEKIKQVSYVRYSFEPLNDAIDGSVEVIGNIHDNPELLGEK